MQEYEKASASWQPKLSLSRMSRIPFPVAWVRGKLFEGFHALGIVSVISCGGFGKSVTNVLV